MTTDQPAVRGPYPSRIPDVCGRCGGTGVVHGPGQNGNWTDERCDCEDPIREDGACCDKHGTGCTVGVDTLCCWNCPAESTAEPVTPMPEEPREPGFTQLVELPEQQCVNEGAHPSHLWWSADAEPGTLANYCPGFVGRAGVGDDLARFLADHLRDPGFFAAWQRTQLRHRRAAYERGRERGKADMIAALEAPGSLLCDCDPDGTRGGGQPTNPITGRLMDHHCDCAAVNAAATLLGDRSKTQHAAQCIHRDPPFGGSDAV